MTKRGMRSACAVAALAMVMAACGDEGDKAENSARRAVTTITDRLENATRLSATLSGTGEVPAPGDPDATGTATVNLDVSRLKVCYDVAAQKIDQPVGMHIHEGKLGESGAIVVPLTTPTASDTTTSGCIDVDAALMGRMAATPGNFYVNVHTDTYPQGAVRGQLSQ